MPLAMGTRQLLVTAGSPGETAVSYTGVFVTEDAGVQMVRPHSLRGPLLGSGIT